MKRSRAEVQSRQNSILEYLRKNTYATVTELAAYFSVSPVTVRRDLAALKEDGALRKTFGGVSFTKGMRVLPPFDSERYINTNIPEKEAIARKAAEFIVDDDTVFINSSSTALRIYPYINVNNAIIVTNNGRALSAERHRGTDLIILGGEVAGTSSTKMSMTGNFTVENIGKIAASKCILGVSGISASGGLTSMSSRDPDINRSMIASCRGPVIIVADYRKIGTEHNFRFGSLSDVDYLITDSQADPQELEQIRAAGVAVITVEIDVPAIG